MKYYARVELVMIDFYNAFISYKHADLDSSIAEHIQNKLEHFHVPHNIAQKLKHKKITRIFRDKDELPATSNLTDTITDALEKAEHLIVICSTNTKQSVWVQREIETFLKTHSRDKILTVLCDGDPYDVIPEILLFTEKELKDEDGVAHKVKVPIEPLSCDYRMGKKQADKEELARLASAILGCSYDELQRRRRQYKIRRAIAVGSVVFAALAAFGTYMAYANKKINESYMEALRNRSKYLANESLNLLDDNKRTDALQIALEAMPKDLDDKSLVIPRAERALVEATAAYKSTGNQIKNTWNFKVDSNINMFSVSPAGDFVAVKDVSGCVTCWNRKTKKILFEKNDGNGINAILNPEGAFVFVYVNKIESYSTKDGKKIWSREFEDKKINKTQSLLQGDKIYFESSGSIYVLSVKDGKDIAEYKLANWGFDDFAVSPSGDKIAFRYDGIVNLKETVINIYDINSGETNKYEMGECDLKSMIFAGDHLIVQTGNLLGKQDINPSFFTQVPETRTITCLDLSMQLKWTYEIQYDVWDYEIDMLYLPGRNAVVCSAGNVICILDNDSGEIINRYNIGSSVIHICDPDGDDVPLIIGYDGTVYNPDTNLEESVNDLTGRKILCDELKSVWVHDGIFSVSKNSKDLMLYEYGLEDDEMVLIPETEHLKNHSQSFEFFDDLLYIASSDDSGKKTIITAIDPANASVMYTKEIDEHFGYSFTIIERCDDSLYYKVDRTDYIYKIDIKTGDYEKITLKDFDKKTSGYFLEKGAFYCIRRVNNEQKKELFTMDLKDNSIRIFETDIDYNETASSICYVQALNAIVIEHENKIYIAYLKGKENKLREIEMPDSWNSENPLLSVDCNDDGSLIFFSQKNMITVTDTSFKEKYSINCEGITPLGLIPHKKGIYVLSDGFLSIYDQKTGDLINRYEVSINMDIDVATTGFKDVKIDFNEGSDVIYINYRDSIIIMDKKTMTEIAKIEGCYGYHKGTDRFYIFRQDKGSGYFKHYSVEDLVKKGEKILDGQPIPPEYKEKYGIE